jgi:hypothetical protein
VWRSYRLPCSVREKVPKGRVREKGEKGERGGCRADGRWQRAGWSRMILLV